MSVVSTSDFQKGMFIIFKNEPHQIIDLQFVNPGKGSAFVRTKLKALKTAKVQEFTFKSGETAEEFPVHVSEMQYLYKSGEELVFMDNQNYEQLNAGKDVIGFFVPYLKEGETYQLLIDENNTVMGMRYPKAVRLRVTNAEDAVKGSTMSGARKPVTLETGIQVDVPLFIKKGDLIVVDPESGEYLERESKK